MRRLESRPDNRAATPFFQIFGGPLKAPVGDAVKMSTGPGHHRGERHLLSVLVPLVTGAAIFDLLWRLGGPWVASVGVLPALFLALHAMAFTLGGRNARTQWHRWELVLTLWMFWEIFHGHGVGWAVLLWLAVLLLNATGMFCLLWRGLMTLPAFCDNRFRWLLAVLLHVPVLWIGLSNGWPWAVTGMGMLGAVWCCGTFLPNARLFGPVASRVEGKGCLLTIDDGPDPDDTPALLDLLDQHGQKAVFFVIGDKVRRYPDLTREIVRRGHELGNHTMTHPAGSFWCAGSARTRREIAECSRAIEEIVGSKPRWFRAPAGHRNWFTHPVLRELGMDLVGWRKRAYDTVRTDVPTMVCRLTKGVRDGDILLVHEATPVAKEVTAGVLEATSRL